MKTIVLLAALIAVSASPSFAQTVEPVQHKAGIIDTLIEQVDTVRLKREVIRPKAVRDILKSRTPKKRQSHGQPRVQSDSAMFVLCSPLRCFTVKI